MALIDIFCSCSNSQKTSQDYIGIAVFLQQLCHIPPLQTHPWRWLWFQSAPYLDILEDSLGLDSLLALVYYQSKERNAYHEHSLQWCHSFSEIFSCFSVPFVHWGRKKEHTGTWLCQTLCQTGLFQHRQEWNECFVSFLPTFLQCLVQTLSCQHRKPAPFQPWLKFSL